ncbi:MAG: hypothetical protein H0T87_12370 [Gammaproteobacteria bacterium]|nr:hypothetical protein [Gammaproteobacteria bacterium]
MPSNPSDAFLGPRGPRGVPLLGSLLEFEAVEDLRCTSTDRPRSHRVESQDVVRTCVGELSTPLAVLTETAMGAMSRRR